MKNYAALALLSLTLAACSQNAVLPAVQTPSFGSTQGRSFVTTAQANTAFVLSDLDHLSTQAVAPQVYLNVLPVPTSADSVRVYVKSTFTSPVTCSVTWGDGSASTSVASPTLGRIETQDHAYATFGTYTITVTCRNGASVVGTQSMTVQAGKKATGVTLNFDTPALADGDVRFYQSYQEQGYQISSSGSGDVVQPSKNFVNGFHPRASQPLSQYFPSVVLQLASLDQAPFTLKSFEFGPSFDAQVSFTLTGYKADGSTVVRVLNDPAVAYQTVTLDASWSALSRVSFSNGSTYYNIDNIQLEK